MALNADDIKALADARGRVLALQHIFPENMRDTSPASVVGALLTVTMEHCDSILLLFQTGTNDASAQALLRPAFESLLRLGWVIENEQRARDVTAKTGFPKFGQLFHEANKNLDKKKVGDGLALLHGLTHAGMEQLIPLFDKEKQDPPLVVSLVASSVAFVLVLTAAAACGYFCVFTKRTAEVERLRAIVMDCIAAHVLEVAKVALDRLKELTPRNSE